MDCLWTWSGKCFGYFDDKDLWTYDGKHVGKRRDDQIYDSYGRYLGEVMKDNRLITNNDKSSWTSFTFSPLASRAVCSKHTDKTGYTMNTGYSDFPGPDKF